MKFIALIVAILAGYGYAHGLYTERVQTITRTGPGIIYDICDTLEADTYLGELDEINGWYKVRYGGTVAWVAKRSLQKPTGIARLLMTAESQKGYICASRHQMSAGAKGFAGNKLYSKNLDLDFIDTALDPQITPAQYKDFISSIYQPKPSVFAQRLSANFKWDVPNYFNIPEQQLGLALAAAAADQGVYSSPRWQTYINCLGTWIASHTEAYDQEFRFFILDDDRPNAMSFPGGFIFITKGMIMTMENEDELAFVLAHEIVHVERFHGLLETEKRQTHIRADAMFGELDTYVQDTDPELLATRAEMEDMAFDIFEDLISGRLDDYEREADLGAVAYTVRSGYDPTAVLGLLSRLKKANSSNQHYRPEILSKRSSWINSVIEHNNIRATVSKNVTRFVQLKNGYPLW